MKTDSPMRPWAAAALLAWALLGAAVAAHAQERFVFERAPGALPKDVRPVRVDLHLALDPQQPTFEGRADMWLQVTQPRRDLVLHANGLTAGQARLRDSRGREQVLRVEAGALPQTWTLTPPQPLRAGAYRLAITWTGRVNPTDEGVYRAGAKERPMLATQLEAIHARRVFPAFDEPAFRARYRLTVEAPAQLQVLSNMPRLSLRPRPDGRAEHRFAQTPSMPAYLVAVAVGDFDRLEGRSGRTPLAIYTERGKAATAAYAMAATQQVLPFYERYFGVPYALPKLDELAVPSVRSGAMEDWGLISYIEEALLFDAARDPQARQQFIFSIVAHEIAHQWFGNLVTAASWNDIWLNEAFAEWIAEKLEHTFNPAWDVPLLRRSRLERVLARDAGSASRAIRSGDVSEGRVFEAFDNITYDKGGAVLTMLEQWIGEDVLQRGLQAYMRERRLSNATAGDLWYHLGRAAGQDVPRVASAWTDRLGYPLVEVEQPCVHGRTQLRLRQRPFRLDGQAAADAQAVWPVPVALARGAQRRMVLLDAAQASFDAGPCEPDAPWVANAGGGGFYRVSYAPEALAAMTRAFGRLDGVDQVGLFSDLFAQVQAGNQPVEAWLALIDKAAAVEGAGRPVLFESAADGLEWLRSAVGEGPLRRAVEARGRALLAPELARLGWAARPGESAAQTRLRSELIARLARWGDADVIAEAERLFEQESRGQAAIAPDIRSAVLEAAGRRADVARFERLLQLATEARDSGQRSQLVRALAAVEEPALVTRVLDLSLGDKLPSDVASDLPWLLARNPRHAAQAYAFTREHWKALADRTSSTFGGPAWLLPGVAAALVGPAAAAALLVDQQALAGDDRMTPARQIAERIRLKAAWLARHGAALESALSR